jgi:hypothetical protein
MDSLHNTVRNLAGNPGLEALELRDVNAADCTPTQDADAFPTDEMTEREIDALYVAEMERRDREAARATNHPEYPAIVGYVEQWSDDTLISGISLADDGTAPSFGDSDRRKAWLCAAKNELLRRLDQLVRKAA